MKSKPVLSPQVKKRAHQYVDQQQLLWLVYRNILIVTLTHGQTLRSVIVNE